jgi:hypothetical protein
VRAAAAPRFDVANREGLARVHEAGGAVAFHVELSTAASLALQFAVLSTPNHRPIARQLLRHKHLWP